MVLGYSLEKWQEYGLKYPIEINVVKCPHLLLTGATGSGKSYGLKWMLRNCVQEEKVKLTFCNFKDSSDFRFLKECPFCSYYVVNECVVGFQEFYQEFKNAQAQAEEYNGTFHLLVFDEFPAFITWLSISGKKQATVIQSQLAELLMLSRAYGYGIWMVLQRPDTKFIDGNARDCFFVTIALGNLSKEGKAMIFSGYELPEQIFSVGEGVAKIDGVGCVRIKYPKINSEINLNRQILDGLKWVLETGRGETFGFSTDSSPEFT